MAGGVTEGLEKSGRKKMSAVVESWGGLEKRRLESSCRQQGSESRMSGNVVGEYAENAVVSKG
jgi:hypothetical protein